jgi:hypothetical protein
VGAVVICFAGQTGYCSHDEEIGTIKKWLETPDEYDVAIDDTNRR